MVSIDKLLLSGVDLLNLLKELKIALYDNIVHIRKVSFHKKKNTNSKQLRLKRGRVKSVGFPSTGTFELYVGKCSVKFRTAVRF